jgi:membrane-anchored glycerophosphoryl diester phosphodiesterase (GDPDase)
MATWKRLRRGLLLPFRFPALLVVSICYSGLLYAASLRAGFLDVRNPYWVLSVGALLLFSPVYHALLLPAIAAALQETRANWRAALRNAQELFPRLFVGELVVGVAVIAGGLLLLIPGIYVGMRFIYYKQSIAFERKSSIPALRESLRRTIDWRTTLVLFFYLAALYGCAVGLDLLLITSAAPSLVVDIGAVVSTALLLVWMNALVTSSYVDRRSDEA